jgi:SAM-dependent methyltransferase
MNRLRLLASRLLGSASNGSRHECEQKLGAWVLGGTQAEEDASPESLRFIEVRSLAEYRRYRDSMADVYRRRVLLEKLLAARQVPFTYRGYDACVGRPVDFLIDFQYGSVRDADGSLIPNYRERVVSPATGLNARQRAVVLALDHVLGGRSLEGLSVYVTEAVTGFFDHVRGRNPGVVGSEYFGDAVPLGASPRGIRNEDVTALTFADDSFDVAVTNDVLEHVPAYGRAYEELFRVLRPKGTLLLTVPFLVEREEHLIRAVVKSNGTVEHLHPAEYHGDPVNPEGGILCYQHFGWRLVEELREVGFEDAGALFVWSYYHGILGRDQILFFARKKKQASAATSGRDGSRASMG